MIQRFLLVPALASALLAAEPRPLRIAVMVDQTGSTLATRVPQLQVADFEGLLELLLKNGGEIAVGAIRDRSNRPLLRCRVDQKPLRHAQPPSDKMNPFLRQKSIRNYLADKSKEDQLEAAWQEQSQKRVELFRERLRELLDARLAGATDMSGAVVRADLFLAEPDVDWREPTVRYVTFHSDGVGNVGRPVTAMKSGATVLVVNGSASLGSLSALRPIALESFGAGVRYINSRSSQEQ